MGIIKKIALRTIFNHLERSVISVSCETMIKSMDKHKESGNKFSDGEEIAYASLKKILNDVDIK